MSDVVAIRRDMDAQRLEEDAALVAQVRSATLSEAQQAIRAVACTLETWASAGGDLRPAFLSAAAHYRSAAGVLEGLRSP